MKQYHRIKDLREDEDKTQKEVADELKMHLTQYRRYENGDSELPMYLAIILAQKYKVSIDYIAGLTNIKNGKKELTEEEIKILNIWKTLTEREKGQFEHLYRDILKDREQKQNTNVG